MNIILFIDRVISKVTNAWRKYVFAKRVNCPHRDFTLVGMVHLINTNIRLGRNVTIYPDVMFWGDGPIEIGDNVDIGIGTIIYSYHKGGVSIKSNTVIAGQCYIIDMDHGIRKNQMITRQPNTAMPILIGEDVWIAAGCKILKGACIHDHAVIGAQTVVKGDIPENAIAIGVPAKVIKYRQ